MRYKSVVCTRIRTYTVSYRCEGEDVTHGTILLKEKDGNQDWWIHAYHMQLAPSRGAKLDLSMNLKAEIKKLASP